MSTILHPVNFEPNLEYQVERGGNVYVAGVADAHFDNGSIWGELYLDRMDGKKQVRLWKPKITNPFHIETGDKRVSEFRIAGIILTNGSPFESLESFVCYINQKLVDEHGKKIGYADAIAFFSRVYDHYKQIQSSISKTD